MYVYMYACFQQVFLGDYILDSVTNVTMARHGYPRMAVGACFGGPLLSILSKAAAAV